MRIRSRMAFVKGLQWWGRSLLSLLQVCDPPFDLSAANEWRITPKFIIRYKPHKAEVVLLDSCRYIARGYRCRCFSRLYVKTILSTWGINIHEHLHLLNIPLQKHSSSLVKGMFPCFIFNSLIKVSLLPIWRYFDAKWTCLPWPRRHQPSFMQAYNRVPPVSFSGRTASIHIQTPFTSQHKYHWQKRSISCSHQLTSQCQ